MTDGKGLRMYFFVMYNLSGVQKGIQAGHAAVEYGLKFGNTEQYKEFAQKHKTFIVLDGGGSNDMFTREQELESFGIKYAKFIEPDLNWSLSAIAFIVSDDIYNMDKEFIDYAEQNPEFMTSDVEFSKYLKSFKLASN